MKAAWDQLSDEFAGSRSVLVGDVDCTVHAKLCESQGVTGYPTIKYWKDGEKKDYQGGRDYNSLAKHVKDNLAQACTLEDQEPCTDKEKDFITKNQDLSKEKLEAQLTRLQNMQGAKVKPELKQWIGQRISLLKLLIAKQ